MSLARIGQWDEFGSYDTPITVATGPTEAPGEQSSDWWSALPEIVTAVTAWDQSRQLYNLNLERAQQGLEPIRAEAVQPGVTATVGVSQDVKQLLIWGGIGLAVLLFALKR